MEQMSALPSAQGQSADVSWGLLRGTPGPGAGPGVRTAGLQHWREAGKESELGTAGEAACGQGHPEDTHPSLPGQCPLLTCPSLARFSDGRFSSRHQK